MNYKNYWILLSFSLAFTNLTCFPEDRATQEEVCAVEQIPASESSEFVCNVETEITPIEDNTDFDLDDLNTEDVAALMEQINVIEKQPHDTTWSQKLAFVKVFMQMQANNVWDEFKTDPATYLICTASIIASIIVLIYATKHINNNTVNLKTKNAQ